MGDLFFPDLGVPKVPLFIKDLSNRKQEGSNTLPFLRKYTQLLEIVLFFLRYRTSFHIHILHATLGIEEEG